MTSKSSYLRELKRLLDEWYAQIEALKKNAERAQPETRAQLEKRIEELQLQCKVARRKIEEMRTSQDEGWEELRNGADHICSGIRQLFKDTRAAFREGRESCR
jgi:hypothetical protein